MISFSTRGLLLYVIPAMLSVPTSGQPRLGLICIPLLLDFFFLSRCVKVFELERLRWARGSHAQVTQRVPLDNEYDSQARFGHSLMGLPTRMIRDIIMREKPWASDAARSRR